MSREKENEPGIVILGHIAGAHGVRGWVRVTSRTEPREAILDYGPWLVGDARRRVVPVESARHGKAVIARLEGIEDRDQAEALAGRDIGVERSHLPDPGTDRFYWADLIGMEVVLKDGKSLGTIEGLMATGANDVMVVKDGRERLIPFLKGRTVLDVDMGLEKVTVDWDADF